MKGLSRCKEAEVQISETNEEILHFTHIYYCPISTLESGHLVSNETTHGYKTINFGCDEVISYA